MAGSSRPISGDTLSAYRREEALQQQQQQGQSSRQHQSQQPSIGTTRSPRRLSSPLPPIDADAEDEKVRGNINTNTTSGEGEGEGEDIIHGGAHYSQTANILDPRLQREIDAIGTYQAGPDVEAGHQSRS